MNYWSNLARTYNTKLISTKEIITANTTPVQKEQLKGVVIDILILNHKVI